MISNIYILICRIQNPILLYSNIYYLLDYNIYLIRIRYSKISLFPIISVSLETLLLEMGVASTQGTVEIRSSGDPRSQESPLTGPWAGLGAEGNIVGAEVDIGNLQLEGFEALVIKVDNTKV